MARRTLIVTYCAIYLLAFSGIFRIVLGYYPSAEFPPIALCTGVYLVLLLAEPLFFRQNQTRSCIYLIAQTATICALAPIIRCWDLWALLLFPLVVQAMAGFGTRIGYLITGILTAATAGLLLWSYGSARGFEVDEVSPEHLGLGITRERAGAVGHQLGIVCHPGRGTQVTVVWPGDEG